MAKQTMPRHFKLFLGTGGESVITVKMTKLDEHKRTLDVHLLEAVELRLVLVWMKAFLYDVQQTHGQHMYRITQLPRQGADDGVFHPVLPDLPAGPE